MSNKEHFSELLHKYINGSLTEQEKDALRELLDSNGNDPALDHVLWESLNESWDQQLWSDDYRKVFAKRLSQKAGIRTTDDGKSAEPAVRIHFIKTTWFRYAAAVILVIGLGAYIWSETGKNNRAVAEITDIVPGHDGAILTLADGTQVILDSAGSGVVAIQGGTEISLKNGQLAYNPNSAVATTYNTMTTPKGRQFQLVLPDGSKVWLNAASSITYPTAFTGKERLVNVTGEAYFEVTGNAKQPFKVKVNNNTQIEVLGTSFNLKAYRDDSIINTTLLEGAVRVSTPNQLQMLKPGQQTQVKPDGKITLVKNADIDKAMAWKNGIFNFENAPLEEVMRQLERWYDIDVKYVGDPPRREFIGKLPRDLTLLQVMETLQEMNVKFKIEGRTLIVMN